MKTVRITLDVELRPLTEEELSSCGLDDFDEDCRPTGDDGDLDEITPRDVADLSVFAIETCEDMWAGTNLYAAVKGITVISAADSSDLSPTQVQPL